VVVLGIGHGRREHLAHVLGHRLGRELEDVERLLDLLSADHLRDEVQLARGPTDHGADGERFLVAHLAGVGCLAH